MIPGGHSLGQGGQLQLGHPLTHTTTGVATTGGLMGTVSHPTLPTLPNAVTYAPMPGTAWWNSVPNAVPVYTCICGLKAERKLVVEVSREVLEHDDKPFALLGDPRGAIVCEKCGIVSFVD